MTSFQLVYHHLGGDFIDFLIFTSANPFDSDGLGVEHNTGGVLHVACGRTGETGLSVLSPDLLTNTCTGRE